jgi:hypothetical protein
MGSYNGPITFPLDIADGRLKWLEATDVETGKVERIALMKSLKTVWKIVGATAGSGQEILAARCRPAFRPDQNDFTLTYVRYSFDGKKWVKFQRTKTGFSEFEGAFPDRSLFP